MEPNRMIELGALLQKAQKEMTEIGFGYLSAGSLFNGKGDNMQRVDEIMQRVGRLTNQLNETMQDIVKLSENQF